MVIELSNRIPHVFVDTSALLSVIENKSDLKEIESELGKVNFCLAKSVLTEMDKLSRESTEKAKQMKVIRKIIKDFNVFDDNTGFADKVFVSLAKSNPKYVFVTNDSVLAKTIKKIGNRVFRLSKYKKMFVEI